MVARDKILLRGLRLFGRHGVLEAEKKLGQPFVVDVEVIANTLKAGITDDMRDTLDYSRVFTIARGEVEQHGPFNLIEHLATRIATRVLNDTEDVESVLVRVAKPHVAFPATLAHAAVEIVRHRSQLPDLIPCLHRN